MEPIAIITPMLETVRLCKEFPSSGTAWPRWGRSSAAHRRAQEPVRALNHVSLRVRARQIYGLLGPNGAGKTTLTKILSTLLRPTAGSARVAGHDVVRQEAKVRASVGLVVGDQRSFYWRLTGRQNLEFFGTLQELGRGQLRRRTDLLGELLGLMEFLDRPFRNYSAGMQQRLALARSLLHDPPLLLMDEPTRSLDPGATAAFHRLLRRLAEDEGKTIVLVTHHLSEARAVCDRAGVLEAGNLVLETQQLDELEGHFGTVSPHSEPPPARAHVGAVCG